MGSKIIKLPTNIDNQVICIALSIGVITFISIIDQVNLLSFFKKLECLLVIYHNQGSSPSLVHLKLV
jgi:hypothetical protein